MIGEHQINRFGYYDFEEEEEQAYDQADKHQLSRDWNQRKHAKKEYSRLLSKGLSHTKAYAAAFAKYERSHSKQGVYAVGGPQRSRPFV